MENTLKYFKENEVICKKVEDSREDYGDFIAVFGYGKLTRDQIAEKIKENNLLCIFFESSIRENEYKKKFEQLITVERNGQEGYLYFL